MEESTRHLQRGGHGAEDGDTRGAPAAYSDDNSLEQAPDLGADTEHGRRRRAAHCITAAWQRVTHHDSWAPVAAWRASPGVTRVAPASNRSITRNMTVTRRAANFSAQRTARASQSTGGSASMGMRPMRMRGRAGTAGGTA